MDIQEFEKNVEKLFSYEKNTEEMNMWKKVFPILPPQYQKELFDLIAKQLKEIENKNI